MLRAWDCLELQMQVSGCGAKSSRKAAGLDRDGAEDFGKAPRHRIVTRGTEALLSGSAQGGNAR